MKHQKSVSGPAAVVRLILVCACAAACSPAANQAARPAGIKPSAPYAPPAAAQTAQPVISTAGTQPCKIPAVMELWQARTESALTDLPVGPGDVIDISVPEVDELQNQKVRVSSRGDIELPLIGTIHATGLGESELHDAIVEKLRTYMKNPRVQLFVENYHSRGVAVMGAVQKPGIYDLADERQSLQAMIGLAGGLSNGAAEKVIFSPVRHHRAQAAEAQEAMPAGYRKVGVSADTADAAGMADNSIVLNLFTGADAGCLDLPARPGDVLIVPVAGQVMVEGWVQNPGAFAITPGMTILGAVSAAGGPVFSWWVELIRSNSSGGKTITRYTLSRLESGKETDPPVQSGDVLLVEKTMVGAVPYALYSLFGHFGTGMALPIF